MSWKRTYWVVFLANLVTAVGMMSFLPFFPSVLEEVGTTDPAAQKVWTGVLFGAAPLTAAFLGPVWGSFGDRFGRKLMVLRALLAIAVFVGLMSLARSPWELLFLRVGQGLFSGFVPPSITLVSVGAPRHLQGRVTGSLQTALPAGMILGPLIGQWLLGVWGPRAIFVGCSAAGLVSALLVLLFAVEDGSLKASVERLSPTLVLRETVGDLRRLLGNRAVRQAILVLVLVQLCFGSTNPQLPLYVDELWRGAPERADFLNSWLFSGFAVAGLVATPLWGPFGDRVGHARALRHAALFAGLVLGLCALVPTYAWLLVARIALGLAVPGVSVTSFGLAATESRDEERGGAFGAVFSARALALSIGSMAGGVVASAIGIRWHFALAGLALLVVLLATRERGEAR